MMEKLKKHLLRIRDEIRDDVRILFSVSARRCDAPTCSRVKVVLLVRRAG